MLIPLVACSLATAIVIGWVSYRRGGMAMEQSLNSRFDVIHQTLKEVRFPLTQQVLQSLADLSNVELATYDKSNRLLNSTITIAPATIDTDHLSVPGYRCQSFRRQQTIVGQQALGQVLVMFDEQELSLARWGAALFPLLTGLSSTLILSLLAWLLSERLVFRIGRLEQSVNRIASGDFDDCASVGAQDELGRLEDAVRRMGAELRSLWGAVHRQERQKLIHQMAAGLAHQLRNSLTGARMAIELHEQRNPHEAGQGLRVAQRELRRTEDYVQRILSIADAERHVVEVSSIAAALAPIRESLAIIAQHHHVTLDWNVSQTTAESRVVDGGSLSAAIENLVINALQAGGDRVELRAQHQSNSTGNRVLFEIVDNGPGPAPTLTPTWTPTDTHTPRNQSDENSVDLFEPFVTTKPEGLGLGLTIVRRAAEKLGGSTSWERVNDETVFSLSAKVIE